ncbi:MAG: GNAT family N-acetyltransferase [Lachnospiraceae bacterium]|nr:GNAT family N-acetyltransferase [Lachnospiraceae bacterium]
MNMKAIIKRKIEELLSKEFYCSSEELNGKSTVYSVNFNAKQPYIKILTYRNCVVVCTSEDLHYKVRELLQSKNRDEIFEFPLVYGQTIHYVPNDNYTENVLLSLNYECEYLFDRDILSLAGLTGFENSLAFDENGSTSTKAVYIARDNNKIIGVAGAAGSSTDGVWEIGIDVMEEYRNARLRTYLVRGLTRELLARNIIPFYSASVTNIGSQMVASRCGYIPFWVDTFGTILDGSLVYNNIIGDLSSKFTK